MKTKSFQQIFHKRQVIKTTLKETVQDYLNFNNFELYLTTKLAEN